MFSLTAIIVAIVNPAKRRREDNVGAPARLCRFHAWELEGYIDTLVDLALPPNTYGFPLGYHSKLMVLVAQLTSYLTL